MTRLSYDSRVLSSRCRCEVGLLRGVDRQGVGWPDGGEADEGREGWAKARCSPAAVRRPLSRRSVGVRYYTGLPSLSHPSPGVSGLVRGCAKNPQGLGIVAPPTKASSPSRRPCSFFLHLTHFFSIVPSSAFLLLSPPPFPHFLTSLELTGSQTSVTFERQRHGARITSSSISTAVHPSVTDVLNYEGLPPSHAS